MLIVRSAMVGMEEPHPAIDTIAQLCVSCKRQVTAYGTFSRKYGSNESRVPLRLGAPVHGDFIPQVALAFRMSGQQNGLNTHSSTLLRLPSNRAGRQGLSGSCSRSRTRGTYAAPGFNRWLEEQRQKRGPVGNR